MDEVDVLVIGAGVIGLACASELAKAGRSVVVLERHGGPGRETSSRNSGVVHAGLYYPAGSLKATLCVEGRERLYAWCRSRGVNHLRTGKLVVATRPEDVGRLEGLARQGRGNGAGDLRILGREEVARRDPALRCVTALWSPESGLVDAHGVIDGLSASAREAGTEMAWGTTVEALQAGSTGVRVSTRAPDGTRLRVRATRVINAAGLRADAIAASAGVDLEARGWRQHPCKGQYFALRSDAPHPTTPLVYPLPEPAGLGIHLTRDLGGRWIAGPDATYVDELDYSVDADRAGAFAGDVGTYLPGLRAEHLSPDYAGIRPKLQGPGEGFRDFVVAEEPAGVIHLLGMESPGLTAALAVGALVARMAG